MNIVDFELKKLTSAYSFPPFGEVVLLSLKSTCEVNEVAMDKSWPFAEKSWTICQETLDHLPRMPPNPRPSAKIAKDHLPRMPTNPRPSAEIAKNCH